MVKEVSFRTPSNRVTSITLRGGDSSGYAILGISGLSPVKANVGVANLAQYDGGIYTRSRLDYRNIVVDLKILSNLGTIEDSIENIRRKLYLDFPYKKKMQITFKMEEKANEDDDDTITCYIDGYVESIEADYFSSFTKASISFICPDPYFRDSQEFVVYSDGENDPIFSHPWNSLGNDLPMGTDGEYAFYYPGEYDAGVEITFEIINTSHPALGDDLIIENTSSGQMLRVKNEYMSQIISGYEGFTQGDIITMTSGLGKIGLTLHRNNVDYNIANAIDILSEYPVIVPGLNIFNVLIDKTIEPDDEWTVKFRSNVLRGGL